MNTTRDRVNWISASLSILAIIIYLIAPFYSVLAFEITGYQLIGINLAAVIPILLGVITALGACFFPPIAAIIVESVNFLVMLLFMCLGNTIAISIVSNGLNISSEWAMPVNTVLSSVPMVRPSWGSIVCLILCIIVIVIDVIVNLSGRKQPQQLYIVGEDTNDPFGSGMF